MRLPEINDALFFCFVSMGITLAMYVDLFVYDTNVLIVFPVFVVAFCISVFGFIRAMQDISESINNKEVR